jgi:hypothetical protein
MVNTSAEIPTKDYVNTSQKLCQLNQLAWYTYGKAMSFILVNDSENYLAYSQKQFRYQET